MDIEVMAKGPKAVKMPIKGLPRTALKRKYRKMSGAELVREARECLRNGD